MADKPTYEELEQRVKELEKETLEYKQEKEALSIGQNRFIAILEAMDDGVYICNDSYDIEYLNPVMLEEFGPIDGRKCYNYFHEIDEVCSWCPNQKVWAGETVRWEAYSMRNDRTYDLIDTPLKNPDGSISKLEILRDITERKKLEQEIAASLKEKEVLLQEIHHRVKNNMQIIISLLRLQGRKIKDKGYTEMLQESQSRIRTMALVHEKLYQSNSLANINTHEYIKSLANEVYRSYGVNISKIKLKTEIENVVLNIEDAIPCGLIINELLSNSMKYAFPHDREGEISISFCAKNKDKMELIVSDNGVGLPEGLDYRNTETMGLELVRTLVEHQLDGKIELDRSEGTRYHMVFKKQHYKARV